MASPAALPLPPPGPRGSSPPRVDPRSPQRQAELSDRRPLSATEAVPVVVPPVAAPAGAVGAAGAVAGDRYYSWIVYILRRAAGRQAREDASSPSPGTNSGAAVPQAPAGLDAERIATFPVWSYCLFPAIAGDLTIGEKSEGNGEKDTQGINTAAAATARFVTSDADAAKFSATPEILVGELSTRKRLLSSTECTVCLSDFNKGELIRILPPCKHQFHVACIDHWLATRTTCPVCRTDLQSPDPIVTAEDSEVTDKVEGGDNAV
ncbi:unnamed protein product [Closterium sp. NIES-64]|nr:unnamed protein product [Closterium sp. NIES-65]CAI6003725.1 unnamed protein product [Closterium sp. NIES-64]